MFGWRRKVERWDEDPAVAPVEELLRAASARHPAGEWVGRTLHSVYICACVTHQDAPSWRIFDTPDGIGWRRWSDDLPEDAFCAPLTAAGHADPAQVLSWLQGEAVGPWGGNGYGESDPTVLSELQRWVNA